MMMVFQGGTSLYSELGSYRKALPGAAQPVRRRTKQEERSVRRRAAGLLLLRFAFSWQASRVFVGTLAEAGFHS